MCVCLCVYVCVVCVCVSVFLCVVNVAFANAHRPASRDQTGRTGHEPKESQLVKSQSSWFITVLCRKEMLSKEKLLDREDYARRPFHKVFEYIFWGSGQGLGSGSRGGCIVIQFFAIQGISALRKFHNR